MRYDLPSLMVAPMAVQISRCGLKNILHLEIRRRKVKKVTLIERSST
jgi:hypothetical protein